MRDLLPEATEPRYAESPIKGLQAIINSITAISHTLPDNRELVSLNRNDAEKLTAPFKTDSPADHHWTIAQPQKLRVAAHKLLEQRHSIDLLNLKQYTAHGKTDMAAYEAEFYTSLNQAMHNPELSNLQRQHVRSALKEVGVQTFARNPG